MDRRRKEGYDVIRKDLDVERAAARNKSDRSWHQLASPVTSLMTGQERVESIPGVAYDQSFMLHATFCIRTLFSKYITEITTLTYLSIRSTAREYAIDYDVCHR